MNITITRLARPKERWPDHAEWRKWAYEALQGSARLTAPVQVLVVPHARDARGRAYAGQCASIAEAVLEGALAAGVLGDLQDVLTLTFRRAEVTGQTDLTVHFTDATEPF